jgi:hypothetical protein
MPYIHKLVEAVDQVAVKGSTEKVFENVNRFQQNIK